jgi:hypothetical protein
LGWTVFGRTPPKRAVATTGGKGEELSSGSSRVDACGRTGGVKGGGAGRGVDLREVAGVSD